MPASDTVADKKQDKGEKSAEYPHLFRLLHWVLGGSVLVLLATGLSLHAVARPDWSTFSGVLPGWFWPGRVNLWHLVAAAVFAPALLAAIFACWGRGLWGRGTQLLLLGGGLVTLVTGVLMLDPLGSVAVHKLVVLLHASFGLVVVPMAFLWHAIGGLSWNRGRLVDSFRPLRGFRVLPLLLLVPLSALTTWVLLGGWPLHPPWRELHVKPIEPAGRDVVDLATLPWADAPPLAIKLVNGAGYSSGQTDVVLQALHDGQDLFVKAQWDDPAENRQYTPWKRTAAGWEHLVTNPDDESVYYEDKFSLVFPIGRDPAFEMTGCALYCHAGGGRAYGYKAAARPADVWHWKSVRTDPVGHVDDKYWTVADFSDEDVGRRGDPKQSGGYSKNDSKDGDHPAFLPDDPSVVRQGMVPTEHAVAYTPELAAAVPAGAIVPGIVASAAVGDRGDVTCQSHYQSGRWTVYMRRKLQTGSPHDTQFAPGGRYPFGCAGFDCTSKRHAYAPPVYWMVVE